MGGEGGWEGDGKVRVLNVPLTISCSKDVVQKNKHVAGHVECKVVAEKDTNIHLQYSLVISLTPGTTMTTWRSWRHDDHAQEIKSTGS